MRKHLKKLIFVALMLISAPAWAEDVSIRTLCQMLPAYQPDPSVNYTPGADVHGRMVPPADINKVLNNNFDAVEIPVEYSVLQSLNVNLPAGSQMQPTVAVLKVYHDGRVKYNDQDVTQQAQSTCSNRSTAAYTTGNANGLHYNPNMEPKILGQIQTVH